MKFTVLYRGHVLKVTATLTWSSKYGWECAFEVSAVDGNHNRLWVNGDLVLQPFLPEDHPDQQWLYEDDWKRIQLKLKVRVFNDALRLDNDLRGSREDC